MRRARFLISLAAVTFAPTLLGTREARADDAIPPLPPAAAATTYTAVTTVDTVHLRSGGLYRGRVTEIAPGDHVTVVVEGSGETKRIPWPDVDRVIVASTAVPPPPSGPSAPPAVPATPMTGPRARVHITSPKNVILYRRPAGTTSWVQACTSPCDQELPLGDTYRLQGNGVAQSKELRLAANPNGVVELVVDPPSTGGMVLGGTLAAGGATAAYVGLIIALVGGASSSTSCSTYGGSYRCTGHDDGDGLATAGLVTLAIGAAATGAGLLIFLNSAKTDVDQRAGGDARDTSFVRTPTWRTVRSSAEASLPLPAASFPLVYSASF